MDEKVKDVLMGETEKMEAAVTGDTTPLEVVADNVSADAVEEMPEPKRVRKGVIAGVAAAIVVIAIGVGVAVASQSASSGADAGSSGSVAAASSSAEASKTSAASSSSASASASSAAAPSAGSAAAGGSSAASAIGDSAKDGQSAGATTGSQSQQGAAQGGGAAPSANTSGSAGGNTSGGTASNAGGAAASQPTHTHNWVPITETIEVANPPITETYYVWVLSDGTEWESQAAGEAYADDKLINEGIVLSGGSVARTRTIDGGTHTESITTGYRCSECGATK